MKLRSVLTIALLGLGVTFLVGCSGGTQAPPEQAESTADVPAAEERGAEAGEAAPSGEATLAERQAALAEREQQVAQREAAVAKTQSEIPKPTQAPAVTEAPAQPAVNVAETAAQAPEPVIERIALTVSSGTLFDIEILDPLSSETSVVGDRFRARLVGDMLADGEVAVPAGSVIHGLVTEVRPAKKIGGQAMLAVDFDTLELPSGDSTAFRAALAQAGQKQTKKDAATIGGATAGGALLGRLLDKKHGTKGTLIGAVVGAAVGTAIASQNEGDPVTLDAGTVIGLTLEEPVHVVVENGRPQFETVAVR